MAQRIKGQDVEVRILRDGAPEARMTTVRSLTIEPMMEIQDEGYVGEATNRKDDILNGVSGRLVFHHDSNDVFAFIKALVDRATRRTFPASRIDVLATFKFPNGSESRMVLPDCAFSGTPIEVADRKSYVQTTFSFQSSSPLFV